MGAAQPVNMGALEDMAKDCLDDGCSVNTVEDLIESLKAESATLSRRNAEVLLLLGQLTALSKSPEDNKNAIEKLVGAAARNFNVVEGYDFPGEALGYTDKPYKGKVLLD